MKFSTITDRCILLMLALVSLIGVVPVLAGNSIETDILFDHIEQRYQGEGFTATFYQETPLKAIGVTETATGLTMFKKGGKIRWEYQTPERIHYISDGKTLWIHSLDDNQVWKGSAERFFGKNGGAGFLTDVRILRKEFSVEAVTEKEEHYVARLLPADTGYGIRRVIIEISKKTYMITGVTTIDSNGGETRIVFSDIRFDQVPADKLFTFKIPETANVMPLE